MTSFTTAKTGDRLATVPNLTPESGDCDKNCDVLKKTVKKKVGEGAVLGGSAIPRQPVARAKRASKSHGRVPKISLIYEPGVAWHIRY